VPAADDILVAMLDQTAVQIAWVTRDPDSYRSGADLTVGRQKMEIHAFFDHVKEEQK